MSVFSNYPGCGSVFGRRIVLPAVVLCVAVLGGACDGREDEVRSYGAPKEPAPSTAPATRAVDARPVGTQPPTPAGNDATANQAAADSLPFQWTLPEGWKHDPQPRAMRVATVNVESDGKRGELIVTRFRAGGFGSLVDNLNRWRQQVGLPPVADEKEVKPETTTVGGREGKVYDFTGTAGADGNPAKRNRVVMVETPAGDVWFFRFFGPADLIERQRGQFDALLQSIKFQG